MTPSPLIKAAPLAALAAAIALWLASPQPVQSAVAATTAAAPSDAAKIERGKYIVSASACHDCHTPWHIGPNGPEPDMSRALSGHPASIEMPPAPAIASPWGGSIWSDTNTAISGDWGTSFTANLTPDPETGLGKWTFENFKDTIRTGRRMGRGRELLPPMPWPVYANLTDEDLAAVFAYLQSIPAISNKVPEPRPPAGATP